MYIEIITAFILDLLIGDPYYKLHPVRLIGKLISNTEKYFRKISGNQRFNGTLFVVFILSVSGFSVLLLLFFINFLNKYLNNEIFLRLSTIYLIYSGISIRDLRDKVINVYRYIKNNDLKKAKENLSMIVGRDTEKMEKKDIIRASVETTAESINDGIIAPLFYAIIGGPLLIIIYKAVNTLDSMIGYKNEIYKDFGFSGSRLDDIFNYIPARIAGVIISISFLFINGKVIRAFKTILHDGRNHQSPNSGISEAAVAGGLGVQLGGVNYYAGIKSNKPLIGKNNRIPGIKDIRNSIKIAYITGIIFLITGLVIKYVVTNFI